MIPVRLILENGTYNTAADQKKFLCKKNLDKDLDFATLTVSESNSIPVDTVSYIPYDKDQDLTFFSLLRILNQTKSNQYPVP